MRKEKTKTEENCKGKCLCSLEKANRALRIINSLLNVAVSLLLLCSILEIVRANSDNK